MDISCIDRLVMIVAHGDVTFEEIETRTSELVAANVAHYSKIIDVFDVTSDLTEDQVERVAALLRGDAEGTWRGPVAFVVDPNRRGFAHEFAEVTEGERPLKLFSSLRDARRWLEDMRQAVARAAAIERHAEGDRTASR